MDMAPQPFAINKRASVTDAKLAYFENDFERCLEVCANIRVSSLTTASEVALLTARAFLRTGRPTQAQSTLNASLETHITLDASLTAQMLVATALIHQDDADNGIAILGKAASQAERAHFAVRSEIAFCTALGFWAKREIDVAQRYLVQVDPRSDIIHARALELQAWCHTVRGDYRQSADSFRLTLLRLDDCQARDRAIAATAISTLSIFAAELFDRDMAHFVEARAASMDWSSGLTVHHYLTLAHQALFHEFAGNTLAAYQFVAQAREVATAVPLQALGWGLSSSIAHNAGETYSAVLFAKRAQQLVDTFMAGDRGDEERSALLSVECSAHFDFYKAAHLFARYCGVAPVDAMFSLSGEPRLTAQETYISGVIARSQGESERAQMYYRKAFNFFGKIGYVRRAVIAAHELLLLEPESDVRYYLSAQLGETNNYITRSVAAALPYRLPTIERNSIVASLPATQREVVLLICQGKTNREIANLRHVGEQTIKNMITKHIFRAFGVSNRAALVSTCLHLLRSDRHCVEGM